MSQSISDIAIGYIFHLLLFETELQRFLQFLVHVRDAEKGSISGAHTTYPTSTPTMPTTMNLFSLTYLLTANSKTIGKKSLGAHILACTYDHTN